MLGNDALNRVLVFDEVEDKIQKARDGKTVVQKVNRARKPLRNETFYAVGKLAFDVGRNVGHVRIGQLAKNSPLLLVNANFSHSEVLHIWKSVV